MNRDSVLSRLETFESALPYMYRCTGGEVTAGVGHAILNSAEALKLDWQVAGRPASAAEVTADFAKVAAAAKGMLAARYEPLTQCRLSADSITKVALADIASFESALIRAIPALESFPEPAQEALFDMAFNLGMAGLRKFPKLLAAAQAGDWVTAAAECHRLGISEARNQATAALFRQAAVNLT